MLPKLSPDQFLKLKQLTVLALSATNKILSYNELLEELEVCNVHELEDFLNNECVFAGIIKGKLNQLGRCYELQFVAGRDLMHGQVGSMIDTLGIWLAYISFFQKKCLTSSILQHISHSKSLVEAYLVVIVSAFLRRIPR
ncbi:hypothetical protein NC652_001663 [Populus alba x Populus x berolinensis]|nr:hypothetical protein NC652_001663 [Populus alba x Populus x berolinensis]